MTINYKELSEKLIQILQYDERPIHICEELFNKYGRYYNNIILYHGSFGNNENSILKTYSGFISCTYDLDVAEGFAISVYDDHEICTIIEIKMDSIYCLDIQQLIEMCYVNCPNDELCKYMYEVFNSENEMLVRFNDIKDDMKILNINC